MDTHAEERLLLLAACPALVFSTSSAVAAALFDARVRSPPMLLVIDENRQEF
jgi:hypothetical protein